MPSFVMTYLHYINKKCKSYRALGFDFCNKEANNRDAFKAIRDESLSTALPALQQQIEGTLEFQLTGSYCVDRMVIDNYLMDAIRLFRCYNKCMENVDDMELTKVSIELYIRSLAKCEEFYTTSLMFRVEKEDSTRFDIERLQNFFSSNLQQYRQKLHQQTTNKKEQEGEEMKEEKKEPEERAESTSTDTFVARGAVGGFAAISVSTVSPAECQQYQQDLICFDWYAGRASLLSRCCITEDLYLLENFVLSMCM